MIKKLLAAILWLTLFCPGMLPAGVMAGAGAGSQYTFDTCELNPDAWLKAAADGYYKLSSEFTIFGEGQLYTVYDTAAEEIFSMLDLSADLSWLRDFWFFRWGMESGIYYTTGDSLPGLDITSQLLFSSGSDMLTIKFSPEIIWHTDSRVAAEIPLRFSLAWTLFEQIIFAPEISASWNYIRDANPELWYALNCTFDWYPDAPMTLNWILGYQEYYSDNDYAITSTLTIPDYYGYQDLHTDVSIAWLVSDLVSLQFNSLVSYKRMKHNAIVLPDLGMEQEWQLTLKPELKLDFAIRSHFSMIFTFGMTQVWSNTPYAQLSYAHAGLEAIFTN